MANFPAGPLNGETTTVNGIVYIYDGTKTAWKRSTSFAGNLTVLGNITSANVVTGNVYTSGGIYWSNNGAAYSSGGGSGVDDVLRANVGAYQLYANANIGAFQTYANATFATSGGPSTTVLSANLGAFQTYANTTFSTVANAASQQTQINNIVTNANANTAAYLTTYTGNIGAGNIITSGTSGNISGVNYIFATNYVYPNGVPILTGISGTYSNANVEAYFGANIGSLLVNAATQATSINTINANLGAFQTYANANIGTLFQGNITTQANLGAFYSYANANIGTLFLGNASTQANLGAFQTFSNTNAAAQATSINTINANLGAFQTYANANIGTLFSGNITTQANLGGFQTYANTTFTSYSNVNAAAYLTLGANIGSGTTTANLVAAATTTSTSTTTGALVVRGGAGIAGNIFADKFYTVNGIFWSGNGAAYASGSGGASFTASPSAPVSAALGSFWYKTTTDVLYEYINDGVTDYWIDIQTQTIAANTSGPSMYAGDVFGANITFTGTITGSVGYLIERANVVAGAPPAVTNLDLITAPIMYFGSNSTQNITANIRGNATTTLNSLLVTGQSSTFVIFVPNATAYYVNTIKIDNVTITPFWQGGSAVVGGNANSIDIYTFAVLKTADATFKVFAIQVRYQNLGP